MATEGNFLVNGDISAEFKDGSIDSEFQFGINIKLPPPPIENESITPNTLLDNKEDTDQEDYSNKVLESTITSSKDDQVNLSDIQNSDNLVSTSDSSKDNANISSSKK